MRRTFTATIQLTLDEEDDWLLPADIETVTDEDITALIMARFAQAWHTAGGTQREIRTIADMRVVRIKEEKNV